MEEKMKMTKQEVKDEFKETEGNPEQKHICDVVRWTSQTQE